MTLRGVLALAALASGAHAASEADRSAACSAADGGLCPDAARGQAMLQQKARMQQLAADGKGGLTSTTPTLDCSTAIESVSGDGEDYRGCQTVTRTGRTCQRWDSQTPHKHKRTKERYPDAGLVDNYCRNPDGEGTIWCYTTDPEKRWEYCHPILPTPAPSPPTAAPVCPEKLTGDGSLYRGCQDKTKDGETCQRWDVQDPHTHNKLADYPNAGLESNYCRNPDGEDTIWCYTTDSSKRWNECLPLKTTPPFDCSDESLTGDGADYIGCQTTTRSGKTCQEWSSTTPHRRAAKLLKRYPNSRLVSNYCRNPDGEPTIWCYTTDPELRWDLCDPLPQPEPDSGKAKKNDDLSPKSWDFQYHEG